MIRNFASNKNLLYTLPVVLVLLSWVDPATGQSHEMMDTDWPLLLDFGSPGTTLSNVNDGVLFDTDADGLVEPVEWIMAESRDCWLVLDRNGNGLIDDGSELFGAHAEQPEAAQLNGYLALALFDLPEHGGDDDGLIAAGDAVFESLRLWFDKNQNAFSEPDELMSLDQAGIQWIGLQYHDMRRPSGNGTRFRYSGLVRLTNRKVVRSMAVVLRKLDL